MDAPNQWLLEGEPWVEYRTRVDLLGQPADHPQVRQAREGMLNPPAVKDLVAGLADWPGKVISSHKSAGQPFHRLTFLADLGLTAADPGMDRIITRILEHQSAEGPFTLTANIGPHYGGTGQDVEAWALCDAPLTVYALACFGLGSDPRVSRAAGYLANLARSNGWPCAVSKELGSFRGPGRMDDPCPFATLAMLKVCSVMADLRGSPAANAGVESLLNLWSESKTRHPYIFYMGTDFRKLKVPLVWYDLVHVLDVLSRFPHYRRDERLLEMLSILKSKADEEGRYMPESVWTAWKDWEFGQKKLPSRWLTFTAWRIIQRIENG